MTVVTNLITNGGAETNLTGWVTGVTTTATRSQEQVKSGSWSMKLVTVSDIGLTRHPYTVTPSTQYTQQCQIYRTETVRTLTMQARDQDSVATLAEVTVPLVLGWNFVKVTYTTQAGQTTGHLRITGDGNAVTIYVDEAQVELGSVANPYVHTDGAAITAELYTGSGGGAAGGAALAALGAIVVGSGGGSAGGSAAAVLDATSIVALTGSYVPTISIIGGGP